MAAIAALLDGGVDVGAMPEERRATVGDMVLIVSGKGEGSLATVTEAIEAEGEAYFKLEGASCGSDNCYKEPANVTPPRHMDGSVTLQVTALTAAAAGGHVEALRLLLERGAKADGASGAAALRVAKTDELKAILRSAGAAE